MLEKMREGLKGWMAWVFIAVIGVPLALTFVGGDTAHLPVVGKPPA
jgi:hypothetical protein